MGLRERGTGMQKNVRAIEDSFYGSGVSGVVIGMSSDQTLFGASLLMRRDILQVSSMASDSNLADTSNYPYGAKTNALDSYQGNSINDSHAIESFDRMMRNQDPFVCSHDVFEWICLTEFLLLGVALQNYLCNHAKQRKVTIFAQELFASVMFIGNLQDERYCTIDVLSQYTVSVSGKAISIQQLPLMLLDCRGWL